MTYHLGVPTNTTCDISSVTYVTSCPNQWTICLKRERYALFILNKHESSYLDTGRECRIVLIYIVIYGPKYRPIGRRNKLLQTSHAVFAVRDRQAP